MTREIIVESEKILNIYAECKNFKILGNDYYSNKYFWTIKRGTSNCQMNIVGDGNQLLTYIYNESTDIMSDEDFNKQKEARKEQILLFFRDSRFAKNLLFDVEECYFQYLKDLFGKDIIFYKKYTNTTYGTKMVMVYGKIK